jgi:hypothetical protein
MAQSKDDVVGHTIIDARRMTQKEAEADGWCGLQDWQLPLVLILDDGTLLYPSADGEGNGPGAFFTRAADGTTFRLMPAQGEGGSSD